MSPSVLLAVVGAVSFVVSAATVRLLLRDPGRSAPLDVPDSRKLHTTPTPRGGGLGILLGVAGALPFVFALTEDTWPPMAPVIAYAFANGVLGFIDDRRPMRSRTKFAIQVVVAAAAYLAGIRVELSFPYLPEATSSWAVALLSVLWLVWMTNAFNFMDGLDALAGGTALIWCAALAFVAGASQVGLLVVALAGGLCGFLLFNRPPARIFMGDVGSFFVGSLVAALLAAAPGPPLEIPLAAGVLLCGAFLWDATYTICWRILRGEDWLRPHRRHLFQRLVLSGLTKHRVRRWYLAAAVVFAVGSLAYRELSDVGRLGSLAVALVACATYSLLVGRVEARAIREGRHPDISRASPE